jgi:hypothetical protein
MPKHLRSFLVRCWDLADGGQRVEIEHIQSGKRTVATSVASAVAWICAGDEPLAPADEVDDVSRRTESERTGSKGGNLVDRQR